MTVIIKAKLSLDTLEDYAKRYFSKISNNGLPADDFSNFNCKDCFDMTEFRKMYEMKTPMFSSEDKIIEVTWVMPPLQKYYRSKPQHYIQFIINHSGKGSLIEYLQENKWCKSLNCRVGGDDYEENSIWSLLTLTLGLTDSGRANIKKILDAVYSYINLMRREGPQKRIYEEIRKAADAKFKSEKDCDSDYQCLCQSMHLYEPSEYLTGRVLFFEYDAASIKECLDLLIPEKANVIVFDKNFEEMEYLVGESGEEYDEDGPAYFEREYYTSTEINEKWIKNWKNIQPMSEFELPETKILKS